MKTARGFYENLSISPSETMIRNSLQQVLQRYFRIFSFFPPKPTIRCQLAARPRSSIHRFPRPKDFSQIKYRKHFIDFFWYRPALKEDARGPHGPEAVPDGKVHFPIRYTVEPQAFFHPNQRVSELFHRGLFSPSSEPINRGVDHQNNSTSRREYCVPVPDCPPGFPPSQRASPPRL